MKSEDKILERLERLDENLGKKFDALAANQTRIILALIALVGGGQLAVKFAGSTIWEDLFAFIIGTSAVFLTAMLIWRRKRLGLIPAGIFLGATIALWARLTIIFGYGGWFMLPISTLGVAVFAFFCSWFAWKLS